MLRKIYTIICFIPILAFAQQDTIKKQRTKFDQDFKFTDGIYISIEDVKRNNPIPKARIITTFDYDDYAFFEKLFEKETISILDNLGQKFEIKVSTIWGFSQNGVLYIQWNNEFNRIPIFGNICHFIADKTTIDHGANPYYNSYNYYSNPYYSPYGQPVKTELRQYLIDMETGKVMDYNYNNLEAILIRDTKLHEDFANLKKKKKRQLKFLYLRKYNEKNPFYFETQ